MVRFSTSFFAMIFIVALSNYLVQFQVNEWLTFGALTYPICFLVTELTNRFQGPQTARKVVYAGFIVAAIISFQLATPQIAIASVTAFLVSQLLDISVFNRLRQGSWWIAPLVASVTASLIDNAIFWTIAFWGHEPIMVMKLATGDLSVKLGLDLAMLTPFRIALRRAQQAPRIASDP